MDINNKDNFLNLINEKRNSDIDKKRDEYIKLYFNNE